MRRAVFALIASVLFLLADQCLTNAQVLAGAAGPEEGRFRRQLWLIPFPEQNVTMRTTVFRPPGRGPFPLVIINHGSAEYSEFRENYVTPAFEAASSWFVQHGYAVAVPQRPGHGETGGAYLEGSGGCEDADFQRAGLASAASIRAAVDYMTAQSFISRSRVVLVGHSAGAWGSLALASRSMGIASAVINFAGGLGGHSYGVARRNCSPDRLVATAAEFGRTTRIPTLWIYAENDTFFEPGLARRMAEAFRRAGAPVEYYSLPAFGEEGHYLFHSPSAVPIWAPLVERFIAKLGVKGAAGIQ
jgi:dienelactone hydrolase